MSEVKYTRGPWHIDWNVSRLDIHAEGRLIVSLRRSTKDGAPTHDDAEAVANARLIAAAPQLLEALQRALNVLHATGAMDEARAAIDASAAATGAKT